MAINIKINNKINQTPMALRIYPAPGVQEIVSIKLKQASNDRIQLIESTAFSTATLQKWLIRVAQAGKFTNRIPKLL